MFTPRYPRADKVAMVRKSKSREQDLIAQALVELRTFGLAYPGAHTKSPWPGHLDLAVNDKTFAYLSIEGDPFSIGCKLPQSGALALMLPFASPTGYGLGKSGWVTAKPSVDEAIPVELFKTWIDESYRAQAPKRLVASLVQDAVAVKPAVKKPTAKKPTGKKPTGKKPAAKTPTGKKSTAKKPAAKKSAAKKVAAR
jgi:predicted DNA-binding protein (MmcQ/YjbR family)